MSFKSFKEKSEEMRDRHNEAGRKYINNLNASIRVIEVIDKLIQFENDLEKRSEVAKLKRKWLTLTYNELNNYTEYAINTDQYNKKKQNVILQEIKDFNKEG